MKITDFEIGKKYRRPFWKEGSYIQFNCVREGPRPYLVMTLSDGTEVQCNITPSRLCNDWEEVEEEKVCECEYKDKRIIGLESQLCAHENSAMMASNRIKELEANLYESRQSTYSLWKENIKIQEKLSEALKMIKEAHHIMNRMAQYIGDASLKSEHLSINSKIINFFNNNKD